MKKATVIINENHNLLPEQTKILNERFNWEFLLVPKTGWNKQERLDIYWELSDHVIFVSPIPGLLQRCSKAAALNSISHELNFDTGENYNISGCWVFSNDTREKKELPNGKIIFTVAKTGWYLE